MTLGLRTGEDKITFYDSKLNSSMIQEQDWQKLKSEVPWEKNFRSGNWRKMPLLLTSAHSLTSL